MSDTEWVDRTFPGEGAEIPTDDERDRANAIIATWSTQWGERWTAIPSMDPSGRPTNRAFIRSKLRRWWMK
jgi:hypothetical protein